MKTLSALFLTMGLLAGFAGPAAAATSCVDDYMGCLNDSYDLIAPLRMVANFACFDDYTACIYWAFLRG